VHGMRGRERRRVPARRLPLNDDAPILRYFDCRSRGQGLRFALRLAGQAFDDDRIPLDALGDFRKADRGPERSGPFRALPLLIWGDLLLAETLPIAGYLEERLGLRPGPCTLEDRARLAMVTSVAHLDLQVPYRELLWLPADVPGERLRSTARGLLTQFARKLAGLEAELERSGPFFAGAAPSVADAFVYESLDRALSVFGEAFRSRLEARAGLSGFERAMAGLPAIAGAREAGAVPFQVTASPTEPVLRERVRAEVAAP